MFLNCFKQVPELIDSESKLAGWLCLLAIVALSDNYKKQSLNSVKWSYAGNLLPKLITPIVYFILARLLSPKESGLIAIAYLVVSFVEMSRDAGMSQRVIRSDMDEKTVSDISCVLNCSLGILLLGIIFVVAPGITRFFQNLESYDILWNNIVFSFALLSMSTAFSIVFTYIIPDAVKAIGKPDILFRFHFSKLLYTLPTFVAVAYLYGVNGFSIAKLITVITGCFLFCWLEVHHLGINYRSIFKSLKNTFFSFFFIFRFACRVEYVRIAK